VTWLVDGNVLTALVLDGHVHHSQVARWFNALRDRRFATCLVTQGTLLRVHMAYAEDRSAAAAWRTLAAVEKHPRHEYWDDGFGYSVVPHRHLQGPKQVTDAWLAELARRRQGRLATLDRNLTALHRDVADLVPV
jgi:toxin-antitoxin system PIN domain toxin